MNTKERDTDPVNPATRNVPAAQPVTEAQTTAAAAALAAPMAPIFNTHSNALLARMKAEAMALTEQIADIDARIVALQSQRTDAMLAYSMVDHALTAHEKGRG